MYNNTQRMKVRGTLDQDAVCGEHVRVVPYILQQFIYQMGRLH